MESPKPESIVRRLAFRYPLRCHNNVSQLGWVTTMLFSLGVKVLSFTMLLDPHSLLQVVDEQATAW